MPTLGRSIAHAVLWQAGWFAAVLGAAHHHAWLGPVGLLPVIALHAWTFRSEPAWDLRPLGVAAMLGVLVDSVLGHTDMIVMARGDGGWSAMATPWMIGLWVALASALRFSMAWMTGRWLVAMAFGAVGGALAYLGGERLGALRFPSGTFQGLLAVAAAWAVAMPALLYVTATTRRMVSRG
jgi:hypothetical protein